MSLNFALGQTVGKQIAEKIGLDPNRVTDITITIKPDALVRLTVRYIPDDLVLTELIDTYTFVKEEATTDERVQRVEGEAGPKDDRGSATSTGGREDSEEAEDDCPF